MTLNSVMAIPCDILHEAVAFGAKYVKPLLKLDS